MRCRSSSVPARRLNRLSQTNGDGSAWAGRLGRPASSSDGFRGPLGGAPGAFGGAKPAALAIIVIEAEAVAGTQFDHRIVRADAVAVVALEAIATGKTPARLVKRVGLVEPALHLLERALSASNFEHRPHRLRCIGVVPGIEFVEGGELMLFRRRKDGNAQPRIDVMSRFFAMT